MRNNEPNTWVLTDVALVIRGATLVPNEVTKLLQLEPTAVRQPGPDPLGYVPDTAGQWRLQSDDLSTKTLSGQLDAVMSSIEPRLSDLQELVARGADACIRITGHAGNDSQIVLAAAEMERIARLGIPLSLSPSLSER
ncbi:DUF4279 domain-containing protein [Streptomyces sp. C10-9-1]|uniref:DUF4279 domain-containing protein n=1 Tax=Streptomyces sp. C10-9-1 TaxID=1859285 RepID=UPI003D750281